jgi:outer membrane putative beta-barrel porin/alpha-amylase
MRAALIRRGGAGILTMALAASLLRGQEGAAPRGIQDNSFLMEEAYNQEPGVVQHINSFERMRGGDWIASFTQEYPVPRQTHQLSYTIPYLSVAGGAGRSAGFGDIALNYRYQLFGNGEAKFACAPRLSLLLPTGNEKKGRGTGGVGLQINVAASTVLSPKFVTHTNLGGTYVRSAKNQMEETAATRGINAGQSLIWTVRSDFNVMLEAVWSRDEEVTAPGRVQAQHTFLISPGVRWAWNFPTELQIVPGVALPIGAGPSHGRRAILLYLSFEHPMWNAGR